MAMEIEMVRVFMTGKKYLVGAILHCESALTNRLAPRTLNYPRTVCSGAASRDAAFMMGKYTTVNPSAATAAPSIP